MEKQSGFFLFGDSKPSDKGWREHSEVGAVNSVVSRRKRVIRFACGCFKCHGAHFNETALQARTQAGNCLAKAIKASHGPSVSPQSQAEEKIKKTLDNPREGSFGQAKVRQRCDPSFRMLRQR